MYPLRLSTAPALRKLRTTIRRGADMPRSTCPIMVVEGDRPPVMLGDAHIPQKRNRWRVVRPYAHSTRRIEVGMEWKWDGTHTVAESLALLAMAAQ